MAARQIATCIIRLVGRVIAMKPTAMLRYKKEGGTITILGWSLSGAGQN